MSGFDDCKTCRGRRLVVLMLCVECVIATAMRMPMRKACPDCIEVDCPSCRPVAAGVRSE